MNTLKAISVACLILLSQTGTVFAQVSYQPVSGSCTNLSRDLYRGARGSDVSALQKFLVSQNFPGGGSWMITGLFGVATETAVRNFQQLHNISRSGIADAQTRAAIAQVSCGNPAYQPNFNNQYAPYTLPQNQYNPWSYTPVQTGNYNYPQQNQYNPYSNNYWYNDGVSLKLTSLSSTSGTPGMTVTVYGTGFDVSNNTLYFGGYAISNIASGGTSITFTVPSHIQTGTVNMYVSNARGSSNVLAFTLQSNSANCGSYYQCCTGTNCNIPGNNIAAPSISYLNPAASGVGNTVTIMGSGFSTTGNTVHFGNGIIIDRGSSDGRSVSFVVPDQLVGYGSQRVTLGTYNISVTNSAGYTSNSVSFTVTSAPSGGTVGNVSLSYLSPTYGNVGTQIRLQGSGFTPYDNTIHFGNGGIAHVSSIGGALYFTVPSTLSPCDVIVSGNYCALYMQNVTQGTYQVYVNNSNGSSNTLTFIVQ